MRRLLSITIALVSLLMAPVASFAADLIQNVYGRDIQSLNGKWAAIPDLYDQGERMKIYENNKPTGKTDFYEYSFEGGMRLNVPGDWNSQSKELKYYEGTVWYQRTFTAKAEPGTRRFLYFAGVSTRCNIYLNGKKIISHEGSFTPFQIEVTNALKDGENLLVCEVNNNRRVDAIPAMSYDWWNYGGITRDVMLVTVPTQYIADYFVRLEKGKKDVIALSVSLSESVAGKKVTVKIPELKVNCEMTTDAQGKAEASVKVRSLQRWSPESPKLYNIEIASPDDKVTESIGFRNIDTRGTKVFLNDKEIFLRSISFHEEIPQRMGRAFSPADADMLLSEARALGVNTIRLAHYPQNEYIVRKAEQMGFMLWEEIPVWQSIDFTNDVTMGKARTMFDEMLQRDKNRCAVSMWGVANETRPSEARNAFLTRLVSDGRAKDNTRLYVAAFDIVYYQRDKDLFTMEDSFPEQLDLIGVNKYMGWYAPWPKDPKDCHWQVCPDKPLLITEFGGEALYGQSGDETVASSWSEDYQAKLYRDNIRMFENIPNLCGVSPWILFDFRSPFRFHPTNQDGWNRKGLVSDQGMRKKAWYIMRDYYRSKAK
ncbi:MAG: glycoside hydrolase family 2 [Prevotella sp.]|nr:glycoside hydrolase family 2 [Prevotella sp.]